MNHQQRQQRKQQTLTSFIILRKKRRFSTMLLLIALYYFLSVDGCFPNFVISREILSELEKRAGPDSCTENQLFFEATRKCYAFGDNENGNPCGPNMVLERKLENPKIGRCECDIMTRPLFYSERNKQCYFVQTQGPCRSGEWIDVVDGLPKCVHNPCASDSSNNSSTNATLITESQSQRKNVKADQIVLFNGNCTELNSRCKPEKGTRGQVQFIKGKLQPECKTMSLSGFAIGAIASLRCPENTYRTLDGRACQAPIYFDFDF